MIRTGESETVAAAGFAEEVPLPFDLVGGESGSGVVCFAISLTMVS